MSDAMSIGNFSTPPIVPNVESPTHVSSNEIEACESVCKGFAWRNKVRHWVDFCKDRFEDDKTLLDHALPNGPHQRFLDAVGRKIEELLAPAHAFNRWVNDNGMGAWYERLCICLAKLPLRLAADLVKGIYAIVKTIAYSFVHPLKATLDLGKVFVETLYSLTEPITYTKMGAAGIGGALGQVALSAGFGIHAYIGLGICGGALIFGVVAGAIEAGITEKNRNPAIAVGLELWEHTKATTVALIIGFIFGVTFGAIWSPFPGATSVSVPTPDIALDEIRPIDRGA